MKKIFLMLIISILIFASCEQVQDFINYFVDIEAEKTEGTVNTEFEFTANTNDIVSSWIIDGSEIPARYTRNAEGNDLSYSFNSGSHTIEVITENGATDSIEISVLPVDTVFTMSGVQRAATTEIYLDYPILTVDGTEYNVETTDGGYHFIVSNTETSRVVNISMEVDSEDFFYFMNNNAYNIEGIDINNMSIEDVHKMIRILFPERYIEPEPPYSIEKYSLSGVQRAATQLLYVYPDNITVNGTEIYFDDITAVYGNDTKTYMMGIEVDSSDFFLFMSGNCQNFFGFDPMDMLYDEFVILSDIIRRYPEENIWDLSEEYGE